MRQDIRALVAVAAVGSLPLTYLACVGDSTVGSDGGLDASDAGTSDVKNDSPSLGCPLGCLPPAPSGWTGPSAVYDGPPATAPTACPTSYTQKEVVAVQGPNAAPADCDCGAPAFAGASCTANLDIYSGAGCTGGFPLLEGTVTVPGGNCLTSTHSGYFELTAATLTPGTCSFPTPTTALADASVTTTNVSCGLPQNAACSTSTSCVATPLPDAPFTRLCIHQNGDVPCPNADYSKRFVAYQTLVDTRSCSACAGTTAGGACGTGWGISGSTLGCSTAANNAFTTGSCDPTQQGIGAVVGGSIGPTGVTCAQDGGLPQGDASATDPVTFCCNK